MKKKLLYFLALLLSIFALAGCESAGARASKEYSNYYTPDVVDLGNDYYYYTIDKRTGVVYLSYDTFHHHAITVMLNADGTPVTADQLGITFDFAIKED